MTLEKKQNREAEWTLEKKQNREAKYRTENGRTKNGRIDNGEVAYVRYKTGTRRLMAAGYGGRGEYVSVNTARKTLLSFF